MPFSPLLLVLGLQNIPLELGRSSVVIQGRLSVSASDFMENQLLLQDPWLFLEEQGHMPKTATVSLCISPASLAGGRRGPVCHSAGT